MHLFGKSFYGSSLEKAVKASNIHIFSEMKSLSAKLSGQNYVVCFLLLPMCPHLVRMNVLVEPD